VKKIEILFKFAYIGRYLTENTGTARYLAVQTGTGRYLTGIISDINVYRFLTDTVRYARYRPVRYGIYNYGTEILLSLSQANCFSLSSRNRLTLNYIIYFIKLYLII